MWLAGTYICTYVMSRVLLYPWIWLAEIQFKIYWLHLCWDMRRMGVREMATLCMQKSFTNTENAFAHFKWAIYAARETLTSFMPFAVETSGVLGEAAEEFVGSLVDASSRLLENLQSNKILLLQFISITVQRGNAAAVLATIGRLQLDRGRFPVLGHDRQVLGTRHATNWASQIQACIWCSWGNCCKVVHVFRQWDLQASWGQPCMGDSPQPPLDDRTSGVNVPCSTSKMCFS